MNDFYKIVFLWSVLFFGFQNMHAQDLFRIGAAHDFKSDKVVHTFSLDLNRTEKVDEKKDRALFRSKKYYISPSVDINIGDGVTSSENNLLVQLAFGKIHTGTKRQSADRLKTYVTNHSAEFSPSFNSDKLFAEKLRYGQIKYVINFVSQRFSAIDTSGYIKKVNSFSVGPFLNAGARSSEIYDKSDFYSTSGLVLEYKTRLQNDKSEDDWIFKLSGNYYYIISDIDAITSDDYGGIIKASADRKIYKTLFVGLNYKYGNDNPGYQYIQTLELSMKYKY